MKTVILAAGKGTRMGDMCKEVPKPLLQVKDRSLLAHKLDAVSEVSTAICLVVAHMADKIKAGIGDSWKGIPITYCIQPEMKGTADALNCAKEFIGNDPFLVLMGDDIYQEEDIRNLVQNEYGILLFDSPNPKNEGKCIIDDEGNMKEIINDGEGKIERNLIVTGAYMLQPEYFSWMPEAVPYAKEIGIPQTIAAHAHEKKIRAIITEKWYKINTPEELLQCQLSL